MALDKDFRDYVIELLEPLGPVTFKHMFGGAGLYLDGTIFAILANDALFLKVDDVNRPDFEAEDMAPFDPFDDAKRLIRAYHECPPRLLEDGEQLCVWARRSWEVGRRTHIAKTNKKRKKG